MLRFQTVYTFVVTEKTWFYAEIARWGEPSETESYLVN